MNEINHIFVRLKGGFITRIFHDDISHITADKDYCKIFTEEKMFHIHSTLRALVKVLPTDKFYQCHRSAIINIDKIQSINKDFVHLGDKVTRMENNSIHIERNLVPVSKAFKYELVNKINILPTSHQYRKKIV